MVVLPCLLFRPMPGHPAIEASNAAVLRTLDDVLLMFSVVFIGSFDSEF